IRKNIQQYGDLAPKIFKSITSDNGSEFATLSEIVPFADVYYAHPYSSFERRTNEKQNSLLRRFFPKGKRIDDVSDEAILKVQNWINELPRKIFNYSS
ncbi:MAG: IS30 family transposase, partial [Acutalibacteraceae bacterium]|nr:IS30 family transposase [Acutalibacteraceae bacterium]